MIIVHYHVSNQFLTVSSNCRVPLTLTFIIKSRRFLHNLTGEAVVVCHETPSVLIVPGSARHVIDETPQFSWTQTTTHTQSAVWMLKVRGLVGPNCDGHLRTAWQTCVWGKWGQRALCALNHWLYHLDWRLSRVYWRITIGRPLALLPYHQLGSLFVKNKIIEKSVWSKQAQVSCYALCHVLRGYKLG